MLTKEEILETGNWYLSDYINSHEGYYSTKYSISNDGWVFYMKRRLDDGFTIIREEHADSTLETLFQGLIMDLNDLNNITRMLDLNK